MQCPVDQTVLQMTDRQGVEIDYCPTCRGVWLDRGELDKIIEKSEAQAAPAPATRQAASPSPGPDPRTESAGYPPQQAPYAQPPYQQYPQYPGSPDSPDYRGGYDPRYGQQRRRKGFLGDLFDF
jgi:uncharacterized protein